MLILSMIFPGMGSSTVVRTSRLLSLSVSSRWFASSTSHPPLSEDDLTFQEQKVNVNGVEINCVKKGEGPHNVLLMPGALGSAWTDFAPQLKTLDPNIFSLVAWDPPGYGKSIPPYREFPLNFLEKDADTALLLMRVAARAHHRLIALSSALNTFWLRTNQSALDVKKFSLLGWSDGGISSMFLASKYPEYVRKMVIWGVNSYVLNTELAAYEGIRDVSKWSKRMRDPLEQLYGESYLQEMWSGWCDAMSRICSQQKGDICKEHLIHIQCPTLVLYGAKDTLVHPEHLSILKANIRNAVCHVYPEGGHNIHLKYSDDFNQRVTQFLAS